MQMSKLTIRLPKEEVGFARQYAKNHGMSLTELIARYFRSIQRSFQGELNSEVQKIAGLIPEDIDARKEYLEYIEAKHS